MAIVLTHSREGAEEIVQDVFLALWQRHEQLPLHLDIRAYLYAAVRNLSKQRARHDAVVMRFEHAVGDETASPPAMGQGTVDAAAQVESDDFSAAFSHALQLLTARERIALRLRLEEDFTFDQIGDALGISKMGAHKIVMRAEHKIRELLADYRE
jgi:RNA polymerase sigma-70 factor (ECF subfamily)